MQNHLKCFSFFSIHNELVSGIMSNKLTCFAFVYVFAVNGRANDHKRESGLVRYAEIRCDTSFSSVNWQYLPMLKLSGIVKGLKRLKPWPITRCAFPFSSFCTFMSTQLLTIAFDWFGNITREFFKRWTLATQSITFMMCSGCHVKKKDHFGWLCVNFFSRNIQTIDAWRRRRRNQEERKEDSPPVASRFKTR